MTKKTESMLYRLRGIGISGDHAVALRRISMQLHRWHELECGDGNSSGSWAIERDDNGDGPPFMVHHYYMHGKGKDYTTRTRIADREGGARKRLAEIMAQYDGMCGRPALHAYIQGDPRGCALYIIRPGDVPLGGEVDSYYNRGIAVY